MGLGDTHDPSRYLVLPVVPHLFLLPVKLTDNQPRVQVREATLGEERAEASAPVVHPG